MVLTVAEVIFPESDLSSISPVVSHFPHLASLSCANIYRAAIKTAHTNTCTMRLTIMRGATALFGQFVRITSLPNPSANSLLVVLPTVYNVSASRCRASVSPRHNLYFIHLMRVDTGNPAANDDTMHPRGHLPIYDDSRVVSRSASVSSRAGAGHLSTLLYYIVI